MLTWIHSWVALRCWLISTLALVGRRYYKCLCGSFVSGLVEMFEWLQFFARHGRNVRCSVDLAPDDCTGHEVQLHCCEFHTGISDSVKDICERRSGSVWQKGQRRGLAYSLQHRGHPSVAQLHELLTLARRNCVVAADELMVLRESLLLVAWVGKDRVVVFGVCGCRSDSALRSGSELVMDRLQIESCTNCFMSSFVSRSVCLLVQCALKLSCLGHHFTLPSVHATQMNPFNAPLVGASWCRPDL